MLSCSDWPDVGGSDHLSFPFRLQSLENYKGQKFLSELIFY